MTPQAFLFIYVVSLLAAISALSVYYERRRKRFEPTPSEDHVFRCRKCAFVYTDDSDVDRSRCPHCGMVNDMIEF
jgi:predicted Zn-ribbon and HTH transcriptional regulator